MAAVDLSGGVSVGLDYNTNAYERSTREGPIVDDTSTIMTARVGAKTRGEGPLRAQLQGQYTLVDSFHIDPMDRGQHAFDGSVEWSPIRLFDISVAALHSRLPFSLADGGGERAILQTTSQAQATLRLRPTPRWQIGFTPVWNETKTPLLYAPGFMLRQNSGSVSLDFLGATRLVPGILVTQAKGVNSGIVNATRYKTDTVQGTLNYRVTDITNFSLSLGHSRNTTSLLTPSNSPGALASEGTRSGFSGTLSIQRQLSIKTGMNIRAYRTYQQYDAGVNPAVSTGVGGGLTWAATQRLSVGLDSQYTWTTIEGLQLGGIIGKRKDLLRTYTMSVGYIATRRFSLGIYAARRVRNSGNSFSDQYNGYNGGFTLTVAVD